MTARNEIGTTIRKLRTARNIGSRDLSRRIGMTDTYISQLERGTIKKPKIHNIVSVLKILSVNENEIRKILKKNGFSEANDILLYDTNDGTVPSFDQFSGTCHPQINKIEVTLEESIDVIEWFEEDKTNLKNKLHLINKTLEKLIDIDFSRSRSIISNLDYFLNNNKNHLDFICDMLSIDLRDLDSLQQEEILFTLESISTS